MSGTAQNDEKYKNSLVRLGKAFWQLPRSHTPWPHLGNDRLTAITKTAILVSLT